MANKPQRKGSNYIEPNISYKFNRKDDVLVVLLSGEADLTGSFKLKRALTRRLTGVNKVIFDLGNLEFADSYFLRLLINLRKRLGGVSSVRVQNARPNVKRVFEITGLDKLFM